MNEQNAHRTLVRLLREICEERGIEIAAFSDDWLFCLRKNGRTSYVLGYDFELNNATAKMICKDKAATSDLLAFHGVPRVEHRIFHGPQLAAYVPLSGNWLAMTEYFEACGRDVVCKPNEGTGGRGVMRARSPLELEAAVLQLFAKYRSLALSPYEAIAAEYRVAVLNGQFEFVYRKRRPALVGDGTSTLRRLVLDRWSSVSDLGAELEAVPTFAELKLDFEMVPENGEEIALNWRHNLGQGAFPELLDGTSPDARAAVDLAIKAAHVLGVRLASVDVVATASGLKILELNCGIMMESLVRSGVRGAELARRMYDRIVSIALGLESS